MVKLGGFLMNLEDLEGKTIKKEGECDGVFVYYLLEYLIISINTFILSFKLPKLLYMIEYTVQTGSIKP